MKGASASNHNNLTMWGLGQWHRRLRAGVRNQELWVWPIALRGFAYVSQIGSVNDGVAQLFTAATCSTPPITSL